MRKSSLWAGAILVSLLGSAPTQAQYIFTSVADSSSLAGVTNFSDARINSAGNVAFIGNAGTSATNAYYANVGGVNNRLVGIGDTTPATSTFSLLDSTDYGYDDNGVLTFRSNIATGGSITSANNAGLFRRDTNGTVTTLVQRGVTNLPDGLGTVGTFGNYSVNRSGQVVFGTTVPTWALYRVTGGTPASLLQANVSAPGTISGIIDRFSFPSLDNNGNLSFFGRVSLDPVAGGGVFTRSSSGTLSKVAVGGDNAPGVSGGIFEFFSRVYRNDAGQVAFFGGATQGGSELRGIWIETGGALSLVALRNGNAPGGGVYSNTFNLGNLNASGTGVFRAGNMTGGVTEGIYSYNANTVAKILGQGDALFGSTVTQVGTPMINDAGQIAFEYRLANGVRGILRATPGVQGEIAPEPSTLALLGLVGTGFWLRRRKTQ